MARTDRFIAPNLAKRIREEVEKTGSEVKAGKCPDIETYRYMTGFIAGLEAGLAMAEDMAKEEDKGD